LRRGKLCYTLATLSFGLQMTDSDQKSANVPFALPDDEDEDVLTSVGVPEVRMTPMHGLPVITPPLEPISAPEPASRKVICSLSVRSEGREVRVDVAHSPFQIGSRHGDLKLESPFIDPLHAQLRLQSGRLMLDKMGSSGIFLRIADELALEDFDEIAVGQQRFVFRTTWDGQFPGPPATARAPGANSPTVSARVIRYYDNGNVASVWLIEDSLILGSQGSQPIGQDPGLSSRHAQIERRGNQYFIKDLRSEYGTFIRIHDPVELIDGDCFLLGRSMVRLENL